jgi:hypothetical protein
MTNLNRDTSGYIEREFPGGDFRNDAKQDADNDTISLMY